MLGGSISDLVRGVASVGLNWTVPTRHSLHIAEKTTIHSCLETALSTRVSILVIVLLLALAGGNAQTPITLHPTVKHLPAVQVNANGHLLQTTDGRPFFWLGDTAWMLIHWTTREECSYYLNTRARQGFTVIQTVVLAEFDGIQTPSALGLQPFVNADPTHPNEAYFDRVVEIVDEASSLGLYVALLPTWGDKLTAPWGVGPRIFRNDNLEVARSYSRYLGQKLRGRTNVIWILGGDRPPRVAKQANGEVASDGSAAGQDWIPIWREIAKGIAEGTGKQPVISYHPSGGPDSSSVFLQQEPWLSINGMQSGHGSGHDVPVWEWIARDYSLKPTKPTIDLEPNYEDHPYNPWPRWDPATGYFRDHDVRKQVYRSVFAGGAGVTYGHHSVWQFASQRNETINHADRDWVDALYRPAAREMVFLRYLMESRPYFSRVPDQSLIVGDPGAGGLHMQATRDSEGSYAFIYFPMNDQSATIDLARLRSKQVRAWWYDPRSGVAKLEGTMPASQHTFKTPSYGPDWVLVLDDPNAGYAPPGLQKFGK